MKLVMFFMFEMWRQPTQGQSTETINAENDVCVDYAMLSRRGRKLWHRNDIVGALLTDGRRDNVQPSYASGTLKVVVLVGNSRRFESGLNNLLEPDKVVTDETVRIRADVIYALPLNEFHWNENQDKRPLETQHVGGYLVCKLINVIMEPIVTY